MTTEKSESAGLRYKRQLPEDKVDHGTGYYLRATQGIRTAIQMACKAKNWSLSRLGEELGIAQNTVLRWNKGGATRIEVAHLIQIFEWAGASMDEAFDLYSTVGSCSYKDVMRLQDELVRKRDEVDTIRAQYDKVVARLLRQLEELEKR